ncbi:DoxX family protein [Jiella sp. MQZ9-1]|uniref:DoxX family protein n=1 Tax=Jiella flava TaxID=2816857 RepID=A0A939FWJ2_9HYPH|nr:DoxX family protein [Jiella flava]MBO0661480.1 DoxX family protein [Jiella flava]MCD2470123.1 DoxX family protein [Jiella flava]
MELNRYQPYALALLRIVSGLLFMEHGTQKLLSFPGGAHAGVPLMSIYGAAGIIELVGGLLIAAGLLTRVVAFICSGEMAFAYWMAHAPQSFFPVNNEGDAAIMFCFIFLFLVFAGAGAISFDAARKGSA